MRQLLTGGQVFREGAFHPEALVIENGLVSGAGVSVSKFESGNSIDCRGLSILPGLVDVHVHLREPGFSFKETIASGTAAVISPIGWLNYNGEEIQVADGKVGPVAQKLYDNLYGMQTGTVPDTMGWTYKLF